jgi:AcrR family transcriptional regulator
MRRHNTVMSARSNTTKTYHHGNLAESLISAAASLLAEKGPNQISLREIARNAGVSHGAPAHHFGDKPGLLTAVAVRGHELLARDQILSQNPANAVYERLVAAGTAYVRFAVREPGFYSVMFQADMTHAGEEALIAAKINSRRVLIKCLEEMVGDGVDPRVVLGMQTALWSQVHGFSVLWLSGNFGDPKDLDQLNVQLGEMLRSIEPRVVNSSAG